MSTDESPRHPLDFQQEVEISTRKDSQKLFRTPEEYKSRFPDVTIISMASMIGGFSLSIALAVGHHIFLSYVRGQDVDAFSQFWIKNTSNGFASVFAVCLAFSVHSALTQAKWGIVGEKAMSLQSLDSLFAMPAPLSLLAALLHPRRPLLLPILASVFIQALVLVGILAPNALSVSASDPLAINIKVPTLDLSSGPITSIDMGPGPFYSNMSSSWEQLTRTIMLNPPAINWDMPAGCGVACNFELQYFGPALDCRSITADEYRISPGSIMDASHRWVYEANSTLYPSPMLPQGEWDIPDKYDLSIQYAEVGRGRPLESRVGGGMYCYFRNATYHASFNFTASTKAVSTSVVSYGGILGGTRNCSWEISSAASRLDDDTACWNNGVNTRAMCDAFASAMQGRIGYSPTVGNMTSSGFEGLVGNMVIIQTMFKYQSFWGPPFGVFELAVPNLRTVLIETFSNLTLGLIPHRNDKSMVKATVWDGKNVWSYTNWILWAVYAPALLISIPFIINGILSIRWNGRAMEDGFSTFLLTTRHRDLDQVYQQAPDFKALQKRRLVYRKSGHFVVALVPKLSHVSTFTTTL